MSSRICMGYFVIMMLFLSMFVSVFISCSFGLVTTESKNIISKIVKEVYSHSAMTNIYDYDVRISDSDICGNIVVKGNSCVLLNNVDIHIEDELYIEVYDNATLHINDSKGYFHGWGSNLYINVHNSSILRLSQVNYTWGYVYINVYDDAKVYISDSDIKGRIDLQNRSNLVIYGGAIRYLDYYAYGESKMAMENSKVDGNIRLYENSQLDSDFSSAYYIYVYGEAVVNADYSEFSNIYGYENTTFDLYKCNISNAEFYDSAFFHIDGGQYGDVYARWPKDVIPLRYPGAWGIIENANITNLYLYGGAISTIRNTIIDTLTYRYIYTGKFTLNTSGEFYEARMKNYINESSTTNAISYAASTYIIVNSSMVIVENISNQINIYAYDVYMMSIGNSNVPYLYLWYSCIYYHESSLSYISIRSYNSSISLFLINLSLWIDIVAKRSDIFLGRIHVPSSTVTSSFDLYYMDVIMEYLNISKVTLMLYNCSGYINGSIFGSSADVHVKYGSRMMINHTHIDGSLSVNDAYVSLYNTTMNTFFCDYLVLEDGYFDYYRGTVIRHSGLISKGAENMGNVVVLTDYRVQNVYMYNSILNITNPSYVPISNTSTSFYINQGSMLIAENFTATYPIGIYITDGVANITNGEVSCVSVSDSELYLNNVSLEWDIYVYNGSVTVISSELYRLSVLDAQIHIYDSNVTDGIFTLFGEDVEDLADYLQNMSVADVFCNDSNIGEIGMMGNGTITIENSVVGGVSYMFHDVYIIDSNVTEYILRNYLITGDDVDIINNVIPSGKYRELLHIQGTSSIAKYYDAIVGYSASGFLEVYIESSSYYGLVIIGGSIALNDTNLTIIFIDVDYLYAYNSVFNWSELDFGSVLMGNDIYIVNVSLYGESMYIQGTNTHVNKTLFDIEYAEIYYSSINIDRSSSNVPDMCFMMHQSSGTIENSDIPGVIMQDSSISIYNSEMAYISATNSMVSIYDSIVVEDTIHLYDGSTLYADNVTTDGLYVRVPTYGISLSPIEVDGLMENSNITDYCTMYYNLTSYRGVVIDNESVTGEYDLYVDFRDTTIPETYRFAMFSITEYARANISNYRDPRKIIALWVDIKRDISPPNITRLNASEISYEEPESPILCYRLNDETPTYYEIRVDGDVVETGQYERNYILRVNLSKIITTIGNHTMYIYAYDSTGHSSYISTDVSLYPLEPPEIIVSPNDTYTINVGESVELLWMSSDVSPATYVLMINGEAIVNETWASGEEILYTFTGESEGDYNITITFFDKYGLNTTDTVIIHVIKPPSVSPLLWVFLLLAIAVVAIIVIVLKKKRKE